MSDLFIPASNDLQEALQQIQAATLWQDAESIEPDLPDEWDSIACAADRAEREVREAGFEEF